LKLRLNLDDCLEGLNCEEADLLRDKSYVFCRHCFLIIERANELLAFKLGVFDRESVGFYFPVKVLEENEKV